MRLLVFTFFAFVSVSNAQTDSLAVLRGVVKDKNEEGLIGATVKAFQNGAFIYGTLTDEQGKFKLTLAPGNYDLEVGYTGYSNQLVKGILLTKSQNYRYDIIMNTPLILEATYIIRCGPPLINMEPGNTGTTICSDEIHRMY
ncbi:MAG TPA: carboxypeptidase-like regulatory domain-containing protein [Saprospiraceae bacterium]|nr:carboxypeptidase-like regulatory domain-containing protein [Saprospiraceae bacterium]